jgi:beta-exotoxin I transport system permease protein
MKAPVIFALLAHMWRHHRRPLLTMSLAVVLFEIVTTRLAPGPDELSFFSGLIALVPPQVVELAGGASTFASTTGVIALGYTHPFFLLLLGVWAIRIPSAALAGEIGRGTMDLLASRPVSRNEILLSAFVAVAAGLALLVLAAWSGTAIGLSLRPLGITGSRFVSVAAMAWLLFLSFGAVGLLVAATRREAGPAIAWTSGVIATSFVVDYLARVWKPIAGLRAISPFAYYQPQQIVSAGVRASDVVRLAALMLVATVVAVVVFRRRDL